MEDIPLEKDERTTAWNEKERKKKTRGIERGIKRSRRSARERKRPNGEKDQQGGE